MATSKAIVFLVMFLCSHSAAGIPLNDFYPFGIGAGDTLHSANDDESSPAISLPFPFPYYDVDYTNILVNNNGAFAFSILKTYDLRVFPHHTSLIAPYWADVDTRPRDNGTARNAVWYKTTSDPALLNRARDQVQLAFIDQVGFSPTLLIIATWDEVGYFEEKTDRLNTFQCILATNGIISFAIYLYADGLIQWTTGDYSGRSGGLGGIPAQVGFNAGDGVRFAIVPESRTSDIINIDMTSNVAVPGMWVFQVDGENVKIGGCQFEPEVNITVLPRSGIFLGGTAVKIAGACLEPTDNITCVFDGIEVPGLMTSSLLALCVSPRFDDIGRMNLRLLVKSANGTLRSQGTGAFISTSFDDGALVQYTTTDIQFEAGDSLTVMWPPIIVYPPLENIKVDVRLHCFDMTLGEPTQSAKLASNIDNTGSALLIIPALSVPHACVFSIQVVVSSLTQICQDLTVSCLSGIWTPPGYFVVSDALSISCEVWNTFQPEGVGATLLALVPPCPPTTIDATADVMFQQENALISEIFHPGSSSCYKQIVRPRVRGTCLPRAQCCYDCNGNLLLGPRGGGTVDEISPQGSLRCIGLHLIHDVIPAIFCCSGLIDLCPVYYARRPSKSALEYRFRPPAIMWGDPHMVTFDGLRYTFNGRGEFELVVTSDSTFSVQGRMNRVPNAGGRPTNGTFFSALAARQIDSDTVQLEARSTKIRARVNGIIVDFTNLPTQDFVNVVLTDNRNNTITAQFANGAQISATVKLGIISIMLINLPSSLNTSTSGVLGNFNGDKSDDLLPRGGSTPLPTSSSLQDIHNMFGITWIINNQTDSLFVYGTQESFADFFDPDFVPVFGTFFSDPALQAQAEALCGNDAECLFDVATTERLDIGRITLASSHIVEDLSTLVSTVITCVPPCVNGACVANDTCNCAAGFTGTLCETAIESTSSTLMHNNSPRPSFSNNCTRLQSTRKTRVSPTVQPTESPVHPVLASSLSAAALAVGLVVTVFVVCVVYIRKKRRFATDNDLAATVHIAAPDHGHNKGNATSMSSAVASGGDYAVHCNPSYATVDDPDLRKQLSDAPEEHQYELIHRH